MAVKRTVELENPVILNIGVGKTGRPYYQLLIEIDEGIKKSVFLDPAEGRLVELQLPEEK